MLSIFTIIDFFGIPTATAESGRCGEVDNVRVFGKGDGTTNPGRPRGVQRERQVPEFPGPFTGKRTRGNGVARRWAPSSLLLPL